MHINIVAKLEKLAELHIVSLIVAQTSRRGVRRVVRQA